jgi:hypothetical protein
MKAGSARGKEVWRAIGRLPAWFDILVIVASGLAFALLSLNAPFNADEDQYIAGAVLAASEVIYRDFMHLQTPLQPLLLAPVTRLFPGNVFTALRLTNALLATLAAVGIYGAQRAAGVRGRVALLATVLLALCPSYRICATHVRNDMLPAALSAFAMFAAVSAARNYRGAILLLWPLAGLGFGLATSAKIAHAFLLAGAGSYLLWRWFRAADRGAALQAVLAYSAGCLAGLLPTLVLAVLALDAFNFGVFKYALTCPFEWFRREGQADLLSLGGKVKKTFEILLQSPALPALLSAFVLRCLRREAIVGPEMPLLDMLVVAGGLAALAPTPTWPYYFLTFLLPLFVWLGVEIDAGIDQRRSAVLAVIAVTALFALGVLPDYGRLLLKTVRKPPELWLVPRVEAEAEWIGGQLQAMAAQGTIATLSPFIVVDSGYPLDRRFATGFFVYHYCQLHNAQDDLRFHTLGPATLARSLDAESPAAIVVGYQSRPWPSGIIFDTDLRNYALSRGYRLLRSPVGAAELYVNPAMLPVTAPSPRRQRDRR